MLKNEKEIKLMKISGKICAQALKKVLEIIKPGVKCFDLDAMALDEIERAGGKSSFATVQDYKWATCITINEQVVHGIPTARTIKSGDIVSVDIGALYAGYHSDMATTVAVGQVLNRTRKFIEVGKSTLEKAIQSARIGNRIGDISATIQQSIENAGYSIVRSLTGHGIGRKLHEEPMVPGFGKRDTGSKLSVGMTLALEVIYAQGSPKVFLEDDGWTITTADKSLGGLFEQTIAITKSGPIVLTPYL